MSRPRIVAIDYGTRRVGLAISDPLRMFAQPLGTFAPDDAVSEIHRIVSEGEVEALVIGWPLEPGGGSGAAVRRVIPFRNRLRNQFPDISVVEWDERESSRLAMENLLEAGVPRGARRKKGRLDQAAAAVILQEYLDEVVAGDTSDQDLE